MEDFLRDSPFEETPTRTNTDNQRSDQDNNNDADFNFTMGHVSQSNYDMPPQQNSQNANFVPANDPYFETFDFFSSPTQQPTSPKASGAVNAQDFSSLEQPYLDPLQFNMGTSKDPMNNLNQIMSPETGNAFVSSQYFSPNTRQNFSQLNSIAENSLSNSYHNTFSDLSRHGSISIPPANAQESYLSPNTFLSPLSNAYDGSFDTLKSPYSGSYLNSPPPLHLTQSGQSASIPAAVNFNQSSIGSALSPQQLHQYQLGASAPSTTANVQQRKSETPTTAKQLTQEEKAKRRREFHNAVERRRRDLIKEKIKELGLLVPQSLQTPQACAIDALLKLAHQSSKEIKDLLATVKAKETKPNKATILKSSVQYIRHLQSVSVQQQERRQEIESIIADLELRLGNGSSSLVDLPGSLDQPPLSSEFNPDDFFSDTITEPAQY